MTVVVLEEETTTDNNIHSTTSSTLTYNHNSTSYATTSSAPEVEIDKSYEEEYQKQFFYLRVFVLGGVGLVLGTLALIFWLYFLYLWRTWDAHNKARDPCNMSDLEDLGKSLRAISIEKFNV